MSLAGRTVSHYRIIEEISRGGMGVVYRATDMRLNRDVALKILPAELMSDGERRERFVREARAASALEHPHIAVIHDIGEEDGISYIAMELIRGDKLSTAIERGQFPSNPGRALDVAAEIAEALARAHAQGIVHRDLKPANVMLTEEGHVKLIDFGLAKLLAPASNGVDTATAAATGAGIVMGTTSYMAPEQARGEAVDHRTDIFSFGVLLYELLSGTLPFRGRTSLETMHAIIHEPPRPLRLEAVAMPAPVAIELQRIIEKCLAKDPADRFQGMKDLVLDLRAARRRLDSTSQVISAPTVAATTPTPPVRSSRTLLGLAALAVVAIVGMWLWQTRLRAPLAQATGTRPSVAVLHFENNTGNASMDWLRAGFADMLVTDLSQSTEVEVLSTDRLVQILTEIGRLDDRTVSFDTVQEVARRAHVKHVLLGSYVKFGNAIRINVRLQDAASGRIISTERVDAASEAELLPTMDDLTRRVKARFIGSSENTLTGLFSRPVVAPSTLELDRDLKDVTTASMEAYRHYAAGISEHQRGRYEEALAHFERAVQVDPNFALAYIKMAVTSGNIGRSTDRDRYASQALQLVDRLTPRERYYIEGYFHSNTVERTGQAIAAYQRAVELYPDHSSSRTNLAQLLVRVDQFEQAIRHYEVLRERGFEFPGAVGSQATAYVTLNKPDEAVSVMTEFIKRFPNLEMAIWYAGVVNLSIGRTDAADAAFHKALELQPDFPRALAGLAQTAMLEEDWSRARQFAQRRVAMTALSAKIIGAIQLAYVSLYQGRTREAIEHLERVAALYGSEGSEESAVARATIAEIRLARSDRDGAVAAATRAMADARGRLGVIDALLQGSIAQSPALRTEFQRLADALPHGSDKLLPQLADAIVQIERGHHQQGVEVIQRILPQFPPGPIAPGQVPIRQPRTLGAYWLARAQLGLGNTAAAAQHFQTVVDGGYWRLYTPIEYVRSFYYLGQIAERDGDLTKAREHYRRFLSYWKAGDIDRDKVAEAIKKTS